MLHNYVFCFSKVNMENKVLAIIGAALNKFSQAHPFGSVTTMGRVSFTIFLFVFILFTYQDRMAHNSRLDFICEPNNISDFHKHNCFSNYSSEEFRLMRPYQFLSLTACFQVVFWIARILLGRTQLKKLTAKNLTSVGFPSDEKDLWHELWTWSRFHVVCEGGVLFVMMVLFICTQKFFNVTVTKAHLCTFKGTVVAECVDQNLPMKLLLKWFFILAMAGMCFSCYWTFKQMSSKQKFKEELLVLNTPVSEKGKKGLKF